MTDLETTQLITRELTKWPRLLVAGQRVSEDQANEILVRTDSWFLATNDRQWQAAVYRAAGLITGSHGWPESASEREFRETYGILSLSYLHNDRIASSWIGGPHGWCSWSGQIGCSTYNVGKWPGTEEIHSDWVTIAAAFPYLDLTAQLVSDEGDGGLVGQWTVRAGAVEYEPYPTQPIRPADELEGHALVFLSPGAERGVNLDRLELALRQVRDSRPDLESRSNL